jgi:hypothetical protein
MVTTVRVADVRRFVADILPRAVDLDADAPFGPQLWARAKDEDHATRANKSGSTLPLASDDGSPEPPPDPESIPGLDFPPVPTPAD